MPSYVDNGIFNIAITYPIYDWVDHDVFHYMELNSIPFSPEYFRNGEYDNYLKATAK
jgi:3'-phosphoadenosine 5'-phosphosulfate sulfotransferase (PAPS reductase)/FAD synthetase